MNESDRKRRSTATATLPQDGAVPADFAPGSTVAGKYLVERTIGEGGLGAVVKARHLQLDQQVAIKHIRLAQLELPGIVERFLREARLAAKSATSTR